MRNSSNWYQELTKKHNLEKYQCQVELGLYLLNKLIPEETADSLWVLLTGYPLEITKKWTEKEHQMLAIARHLLSIYNSDYFWRETLNKYREIAPERRGYDICENLKIFTQRTNIIVANHRFNIYENTLNIPVNFNEREKVEYAPVGKYKSTIKDKQETIDITEEIANFPKPPSHNLIEIKEKKPISVSWNDLESTAKWMDEQLISNNYKPEWLNRFSKIKLEVFNSEDNLKESDTLNINKILHLVGMVSTGKSNLMKILTVWAYKQKLHTTIIIGDVLQIFELIKLFDQFGIKEVAPILGYSNKQSHLNRLHKAVFNEHKNEPLQQNHPGFQYLSKTCLLTPQIKPEMTNNFKFYEQPCAYLEIIDKNGDKSKKTYHCPLYGVCPSHHKERKLVNSSIWLATPGSLIYSRIPRQINRETLVYFELIWRKSDLIIIDEVDQVQAYLDKAFSPEVTLVKKTRDGWIHKLHDEIELKLKEIESKNISNQLFSDWWKSCEDARTISDRIYYLLSNDESHYLSNWRNYKQAFTDWLLLSEVATLLANKKPKQEEQKYEEYYNQLMDNIFNPYLDSNLKPNFNNGKTELVELAYLADIEDNLELLEQWIKKVSIEEFEEDKINKIAHILQFGLLVCQLQNRLFFITNKWRQIQGIINLNISDSLWFETPPPDFQAIIPAMAMGNHLAFQYQKSYRENLGSLQFFRCTGVGRWLLLNFENLFIGDNLPSPNLLLLSSTSWSNLSPAYHVDIPVLGILSSKIEQKIEINSEFLPIYDDENKPLFVSGAGDKKRENLEKIVTFLVEDDRFKDKLEELKGKKILLVVNSYQQVDWVGDCLEKLGWKENIIKLSRDDENIDQDWDLLTLQRGQAKDFANMKQEILIAPLKALERGHNIVNDQGIAIIGAAYFLVFPHPSPDDLSYAIHGINRWIIDNYQRYNQGNNLLEIGNNFRKKAYLRWRELLSMSVVLRLIPDEDLIAIYWDIIVSLWQIIGRLIRGGANAQLFWCDAKFAPISSTNSDDKSDCSRTSSLVAIKNLMAEYFEDNSTANNRDKLIVKSLYEPFFNAIKNTKNLSN